MHFSKRKTCTISAERAQEEEAYSIAMATYRLLAPAIDSRRGGALAITSIVGEYGHTPKAGIGLPAKSI